MSQVFAYYVYVTLGNIVKKDAICSLSAVIS